MTQRSFCYRAGAGRLALVLSNSVSFFQFASYHQGDTTWLQWTTVISFLTFTLVFDCAFTNESSFLFDPDADNWRRKTVRQPNRTLLPNVARFLPFNALQYSRRLWVCKKSGARTPWRNKTYRLGQTI